MDRILQSKPQDLQCCCCGSVTTGRQWFNRDNGYGLCTKCANYIENKEGTESLRSMAGIRGVHFDLDHYYPRIGEPIYEQGL